MNTVYLLTGGNVGNRLEYLAKAQEGLARRCGQTGTVSSIYETAAWGKTDQPAFLNQVIQLHTLFAPPVLLEKILSIEHDIGRIRQEKYGPRTIDIDILLYGEQVIETPGLIIPHPRLAERRFVLVPLAEIAPQLVHPVYHETIESLLRKCTDPLTVKKFSQV